MPSDFLVSVDVLNPLVAEMQPALDAKGMTVEFACDGGVCESHVRADAEKLGIVLRNLLSNAVKYGTPNTAIRVVMKQLEDGVELSVENDGPNIPERNLARLFQKFTRLDATQGTKGSGLGLYNARRIVELWGGTIRAESTARGTLFAFTLTEA